MKPWTAYTSTQLDGRTVVMMLHGRTAWLTLDTTERLPRELVREAMFVLGGEHAPPLGNMYYLRPEAVPESLRPVQGVTLDDLVRPNDFARWLRTNDPMHGPEGEAGLVEGSERA